MIVSNNPRHDFLTISCFAALLISLLFHTSLVSAGEATSVTGDVTATVEAVRAWTPPDTRFALLERAPTGPYYLWTIGGVGIGGGPSVLIQSEGQADRATIFVEPGGEFTRRGVKVPTPKGKFVEVLVVFRNTSKTATFTRDIGKDNKVSIRLEIPGDQPIYPVDFVLPGLSSSRMDHLKKLQSKGLTVVSEFTGTLGVRIGEEGLTWVILQYDVAKKSTKGNLKILDAKTVPINWK